MKISNLLPFLVASFVAMFSFSSCNRFEGSQEIPAYIHVDAFSLTTNYEFEGSASHNITDVWLYIDGNLQGCYELPATIPVLERGKHDIILYPGVKLNGISQTRVIYPFYKPYSVEDFELEEKRVDTMCPSITYYSPDESTIEFEFIEDFERQVMLENAANSDTTIIRTERDSPENWNDEFNNSHYSGYVWLGVTDSNDTIDYFCILSDEYHDLPDQGNSIILEMDYKSNEIFQVGLRAKISGEEIFPLYNVNPSPDKWNKIYLNLGPRITDTPEASWFKFYISGSTDPGKEAEYYFDNIKLIYRD